MLLFFGRARLVLVLRLSLGIFIRDSMSGEKEEKEEEEDNRDTESDNGTVETTEEEEEVWEGKRWRSMEYAR